MSWYIKVDDIKSALCEAVDKGAQLRRGTTVAIIKILGTVPRIEINEDCISREWVLEEFEKGKEKISKSEYFDELMWLVKHAPSVVPTTEQSSMVGEWIEVDDGRVSCKCSICKEEYLLYEEDVFGRNYCPNYGAKTKGEEE